VVDICEVVRYLDSHQFLPICPGWT
jgi:hypothetical protein